MYRMILIDDDPVTLRLLSGLFQWETLGFRLQGAFPNPAAAERYLSENSVDLIVSDIRMPKKTGLELARECYERYPDTCFIFISTSADFAKSSEAKA